MPKFSIITVNFNDAAGLKKTIESVIGQRFTDYEYLVIDGASTDGSLEVIRAYEPQLTFWLSEKDKGVYEAMNKGLKHAQGTYVLFLNSGDYFVDENVLLQVSPKMKETKDIYYGNLLFHSKKGPFLREYPEKLTFSYFLERSLPHPGSFIKRTLFEDLFYYSETFKIISDWEFFIYAICKAEVSYEHLKETISVFDLQGMSNKPENKSRIEAEKREVYQKYFQPYYEEALKYAEQRAVLENKNIQRLQQLNQHPTSRKWASRMLRLVTFIFGKS
ncbi:MAG: glycosyltransferase family 2 protein [Flavobacteriaceae bacterium]